MEKSNIEVYKCSSVEEQIKIILREIIRNKYTKLNIIAYGIESQNKLIGKLEEYNLIKDNIIKQDNSRKVTFLLENLKNNNKANFYLINNYLSDEMKITLKEIDIDSKNIFIFQNIKQNKFKLGIETYDINYYSGIQKLFRDSYKVQDDTIVVNITYKKEEQVEPNVYIEHIDSASKVRRRFLYMIAQAAEHIYIMSPWINGNACNEDVIELIKEALDRDVHIEILYGIGSNDDKRDKISDDTIKSLEEIFKQYINEEKLVIKKGDTHYKIILSDGKYILTGSLNYLSNKAENNNTIEAADYIISEAEFENRKKYFKVEGEFNG